MKWIVITCLIIIDLETISAQPIDSKQPRKIILGASCNNVQLLAHSALNAYDCFPRSERLGSATRITTQSEGISCSAWRRLVQPAIMNPTPAVKRERNFMKWRTLA